MPSPSHSLFGLTDAKAGSIVFPETSVTTYQSTWQCFRRLERAWTPQCETQTAQFYRGLCFTLCLLITGTQLAVLRWFQFGIVCLQEPMGLPMQYWTANWASERGAASGSMLQKVGVSSLLTMGVRMSLCIRSVMVSCSVHRTALS